MHLRLRFTWSILFLLLCLIIIHLFNFYRPLKIELDIKSQKSTVLRLTYAEQKYHLKKLLRFPLKSSQRNFRKARFFLPAQKINKIKIFPGNYKRKILIKRICLENTSKKICWNARSIQLYFNSYLNSRFRLTKKHKKLLSVHTNGRNSFIECKAPFLELHKKLAFRHLLYYGLIFTAILLSCLFFTALNKHFFHSFFHSLQNRIVRWIKWLGPEHLFTIKFFTILGIFELYAYFFLFQFTDGSEGLANFSNGFGVLDVFFLEFLIMALAGIWLLSHRKLFRKFFYFLLAVFILIHSLQFLSIYFSNDFLTLDAILNIRNISLLISPFNLIILLSPTILFTILFIYIIEKINPKPVNFLKKTSFSALIILIAFFSLYFRYSSQERRKNVDHLEKKLAFGHTAPLLALGKLFHEAIFPGKNKNKHIQLNPFDLKIAKKYGFYIKPNSYYPFIKDWISKYPFPYTPSKKLEKPNIILILAESLSARKIGVYGSPFPNISPNLDHFAKKSTVVENYYNHVSPTIRGIKGQLCSLFPSFGYQDWINSRVRTGRVLGLPHILNQHGYRTIYLNHDAPEVTYFEEQIKQFGFSESYFDEKIIRELLPGEKTNTWGLSDHQMIRALNAFLKKQKPGKPFFVALSNIETHTGMNVYSEDGKKYPLNPKKSNVLNTTYNFDHAFGMFWDYFQKSPFYRNTIVIVTADHAHYPSWSFKKVAGKNYKKYYSDKIALLIYHPAYTMPRRYKISSSSLDLAPTVLHMIGITNQKNAFLGLSLFGERKKYKQSIGTYKKSIYLFNPKTIRAYRMNKKYRSKELQSLIKLLLYFKQIERQNRIWK